MNQQIFNRKIQGVLNDVKDEMRSALADSGITQEALADETQTTQPSINRWYSYDLSHFPPIYHLALVPEAILVRMCNYFGRRFGMRMFNDPANIKTDGRIDDNILNIDVLIGDIIKLKTEKPDRVVRACDRLLIEVYTLQKEAQQQIDAQKRIPSL